MKMIILAAGKGERLMPLTRNTPKPLLDLGNGNTLLEEQVQSMARSGVVHEIVLVIGYLADQVEAKMQRYRRGGIAIRTVFNPFHEVSNNLMSLWLAKHEMAEQDFMVTNGDNLFVPEVFRSMVTDCGEGISLALSRKSQFESDDMKVALEHGLVARVSKRIDDHEAQAESPGLTLVKGNRSVRLFREHLEVLARQKAHLDSFWLEVLNGLYESGVPVHSWFFDGATQWQEVDFHADVQKLKTGIYEKLCSFHESSLVKH